MQLFKAIQQTPQPKSPQATYHDLLRQKRQLQQIIPISKKQKECVEAQLQYTERLISFYKRILGLKTPK